MCAIFNSSEGKKMDILVTSGRFSKDLTFGFHFVALPRFLLFFHVFIFTVGGRKLRDLNAICLSLSHLV